MAVEKDARLKRAGVSGFNKPKATPNHKTKSHVVVAKVGGEVKTIRFGQQGASGSPDGSAKNKAFKALYANIQAKRKRIASGSGEKMRKVGTKGAPTAKNFKQAAKKRKK